jgi:phosphatidylserine/phosphatidylglycerophosphate/cardiolipin synthase-like enzyme
MLCKNIDTVFGAEFPKKVMPLIDSAKNSIHIIVFDWRWYPVDPGCICQRFNSSISNAARRGVKVSAMINSDDIVNTLKQCGVLCHKLISKRLLHSKIIIIDEKHLVIGSHNYTQNAFSSNFESSVILYDCDDLTPFIKYFNSLFVQ